MQDWGPDQWIAHARRIAPAGTCLLASDLDGTLLGEDLGQCMFAIVARACRPELTIAYVTGRGPADVLRLVEEGKLPRPDYIVGSVGTVIVDCADSQNMLGADFAATAPTVWDLEQIYRVCSGDGVAPQDFADGQPTFQAGFNWNGDESSLAAIKRRLQVLPGVSVVVSGGRYIDVIPDGFGKGKALDFLCRRIGAAEGRVVVAGDSGNDESLFGLPHHGILPANALPELVRRADKPWHYRSPWPYARGVIDGLCRFGFLIPGRDDGG